MPAMRAISSGLPFFEVPVATSRARRGRDAHEGLGGGTTLGDGLVADVDHAHAAGAIVVREAFRHVSAYVGRDFSRAEWPN